MSADLGRCLGALHLPGCCSGLELLRLAEGCLQRASKGQLSKVPGSFAELQAKLATEAIGEALDIFIQLFTLQATRPEMTGGFPAAAPETTSCRSVP